MSLDDTSRLRLQKRLITATASLALCFVGYDLLGYWEGTVGAPLSVLGLPADLPLMLGTLVLSILILVLVIVGFVRKEFLRSLLALLISIVLWAWRPMLFSPSPYLHGFRRYVYAQVPVSKLREIAQVMSQSKIKEQLLEPVPDDQRLNKEMARGAALWPALGAYPEFQQLVHSAYVDLENDCVVLTWGGGLGGHRGMRIHFTGKPKPRTSDAVYWQPEPDIAFFVDIY